MNLNPEIDLCRRDLGTSTSHTHWERGTCTPFPDLHASGVPTKKVPTTKGNGKLYDETAVRSEVERARENGMSRLVSDDERRHAAGL